MNNKIKIIVPKNRSKVKSNPNQVEQMRKMTKMMNKSKIKMRIKRNIHKLLLIKKMRRTPLKELRMNCKELENNRMMEVATLSKCLMPMGSRMSVARRNPGHSSTKKTITQVNQILRTSLKPVSIIVFMKSQLTFLTQIMILIRIPLSRVHRARLTP